MAMSVVYTTFDGEIVHENRGGVASFYAPDTMGSTVALLNSSGVVTDTYSYWPYGEIQNHVGSSQTPFGFGGTIGYYTDVIGSFLYVRARYLRQALARWQTVDRLWPWQAAYPYGYCLGNPVSYVDPLGTRQKRPQRIPPHRLPPRGGGIGGGLDYGSYCGPATKQNPSWHVLPQDCIDACCLMHDRCLEAQYGAGLGQGAAHSCCDGMLQGCAENALASNCCDSSPTPAGCRWAADTIQEVFSWLEYNPFPGRHCVPSNLWGKYSAINWGGTGKCKDITGPPTQYGH